MILYDPSIPASITEFGIQIPIRDSRAINTFQALLDDPKLKSLQKHWHQDRINLTLTRDDLLRVHSAGYVERLYSAALEQEIISTFELIDAEGKYYRYTPETATRPLTELFDRLLIKAAGTVQASRLALQHGFCFSFTGGAHHAQYDFGNGFCVINDVVIAPRKLQHEKLVDKVWIIDVDAHKGDGTAALTADDESIKTLSVHMASGWPLDSLPVLADGTPHPSFVPSDIDIPIESGEEQYYVERLHSGLQKLEEEGTADLAIVVCGADPYEKDELPSTAPLKLSLEQMFERDKLLYSWLIERKIPAVFLMAGGYGDEVWRVYSQFLLWVLHQRY
ncbi:histone deacetylase [Desulfosediminicola flagellatus]|uniref:histone deacetylase family protein n=1 Tax=Desulfosediminicola flagellatus TaxID=2569541 RepID=UPI0010ABB30D|nr:histone deacetylase [Desulfosediminicola flagellatus]